MFKFLWTNECDPPHKITHPDFLIDLANEFVINRWSIDHPVLIGYPLNKRIQLLSGTHRHGAAGLAKIMIPILIRSYEEVKEAWGTDKWEQIMKAPLLKELI